MLFFNSSIFASKTPTITVSSSNSSQRFKILFILILQNGHDENLKNVRITRFPSNFDISNKVPSMAGSIKFGAGSPTCNSDMNNCTKSIKLLLLSSKQEKNYITEATTMLMDEIIWEEGIFENAIGGLLGSLDNTLYFKMKGSSDLSHYKSPLDVYSMTIDN